MFQHIIAFLKKKFSCSNASLWKVARFPPHFDNNRWVKSKGESRNIVPKEKKYPLG